MKNDAINVPAKEPSLTLGVLSLILIWVPVVGFVLGLIGMSIGLRKTRKRIDKADGYTVWSYLKWSGIPPKLKAGIITSLIGVFGPILALIGLQLWFLLF